MLIWGYIKFFNIFLGFCELMEEIEENGILQLVLFERDFG